MADDRIEVEIVLDDGSIQKGFAKIRSEADKTKSSVGSIFKGAFTKDISRPFDVATKSIFNLRNAVTAAIAVIGGGAFLRSITEAASQQQNAINTLNNSLRTAGTFSQAASKDFQDFASSLQQSSRFGDELVLQQLALARNFTKTNEEAKSLTKAAVDLSEATGISLESAVKNLGKTFGGLTGELGESVPVLRTLTVEQLKAGAAIDLVASRFSGSALAATRTYGGALTQLKNTFGDLLEGIGAYITQSPTIIALFNAISITLQSFTRSFEGGGSNIESFFKSLIINAASAASAVVESFSSLAQVPTFIQFTFTQVQIAILKGLNFILAGIQPLAGLLDRILGKTGDSANVIVANFQKISQLEGSLEGIAAGGNAINNSFDTARQGLETFTTSFQENLLRPVSQVTQSPIGPVVEAIDKDLVKLREKVSALQLETKTAIQNAFFNPDDVLSNTPSIFENLSNKGTEALTKLQLSLQATRDKTVQLSQQIGQAVNNGIANTITNSISAVVDALRTGKNAFGAFAKAALATIGDLAVQLGQTLIASGIGIEALKVLGGAAAIAAGVALVAVGTLIKGASGGGQPNVGGGSSVTPPLSDLQPGGISADLQDQGARVQINIEGNIFDSDETGLRIANILKDQGFQNAVVS